MAFVNRWREQLYEVSGYLVESLDGMIAEFNVFFNEHKPDGTHTDVTLDSLKFNSQVGTITGTTYVLHTSSTSASVTSGSPEVLWTYRVPPDTLTNMNDMLDIVVFGSFASNGNTKTVSLRLNGTVIGDIAAAFNGDTWLVQSHIWRLSPTTIMDITRLTHQSTGDNDGSSSRTVNNLSSSALVLDIRCDGAASGDVTFLGASVRLSPAPVG